ncbi:hypothetical protein [Desulfopila inferna]|uniref:hypothetical protein n=1 Tax=Desulfopila inferna TaxID=468528 RepID=UPI001965D7B9|nr:hypothetical protein [Desulfopila inferna]MBM9606737.1 hypothetical protein [Desulfopila inferna]
MCDDFWCDWDDMDEAFCNQDTGFEEEAGVEGEYKPEDEIILLTEDESDLDLRNAMIVGTMIAGCAFDELKKMRLIKSESEKRRLLKKE